MLVLFDEIYRTQSMTRAAERLDLSQPTASIWLSKLRREWHDPLFVRTTAGMQPTPRADALIGPAREALALLRRLSATLPGFDPVATQRTFRICMTDASHITLLPRLLAHVRTIGPEIRIDVPISAGTAHATCSKRAKRSRSRLHSRRLERDSTSSRSTQDFICLVSAEHPRVGAAFRGAGHKDEGHIGILSSTSYPMQSALGPGHRAQRTLGAARFLRLAAIVSSTDLVATVPRTIGEALARMGPIGLSLSGEGTHVHGQAVLACALSPRPRSTVAAQRYARSCSPGRDGAAKEQAAAEHGQGESALGRFKPERSATAPGAPFEQRLDDAKRQQRVLDRPLGTSSPRSPGRSTWSVYWFTGSKVYFVVSNAPWLVCSPT
jgi:DNA-binding transcriptional LysR family regulator